MSSGIELLVLPIAVGIGALRAASSSAERGVARRQEERASRQQARWLYDALAKQVEASRSRHPQGIDPLPPFEQLWSQNFSAAMPALQQRLAHQLAATRAAELQARIAASAASAAPRRPDAPSVAAPARAGAGNRPTPIDLSAAEARDTVATVLARLDPLVLEPERVRLDARAEALLHAPPGRRSLALAHLRLGVSEANDRRAAQLARLSGLHTRLEPLGEHLTASARRALHAAADEPDPDWPGLERAVAQAEQDHERELAAVAEASDLLLAEAVRQLTVTTLKECLLEAGCVVEEGFDVLIARDGGTHLRHTAWEGIGVRLATDAAEGRLRMDLTGESDARLSADIERAWCSSLSRIVARLSDEGWTVEIVERTALGEGRLLPTTADETTAVVQGRPAPLHRHRQLPGARP